MEGDLLQALREREAQLVTELKERWQELEKVRTGIRRMLHLDDGTRICYNIDEYNRLVAKGERVVMVRG
jgi:hypothetical protein